MRVDGPQIEERKVSNDKRNGSTLGELFDLPRHQDYAIKTMKGQLQNLDHFE
jgi:hypothetical protein